MNTKTYTGQERRSPPGNLAQREIDRLRAEVARLTATLSAPSVPALVASAGPSKGDYPMDRQIATMPSLMFNITKHASAPPTPSVPVPVAANSDFITARKFVAAFPESYFESDDAVPRITFAHAIDHLDDAIKLVDRLDGYARSLAMHLWREHYIKAAPQFELLDDAYGVMSQIDNMLTGLTLKPTGSTPDALRTEPWSDAERERFRQALATGDRCKVCTVLLGGQHFPTCPNEASEPIRECSVCHDTGTAFGKACTCGVGHAISQMHKSTGMRCPICYVRKGEPHAPECTETGLA